MKTETRTDSELLKVIYDEIKSIREKAEDIENAVGIIRMRKEEEDAESN